MNNLRGWFVAGGVAALLVIGGFMYMSYSNQEVQLRNQITAQGGKVNLVFDNTWKIIAQQAQVSDKYKDAFAKIYPQLMEGRYGGKGKGSLMMWITESNPNFDISLYQTLMHSIEGQRTTLTNEQTVLVDLKREHDNLRTMIPSSWFVGSRPEIKIVTITSTHTQEVATTGKDDNVKL